MVSFDLSLNLFLSFRLCRAFEAQTNGDPNSKREKTTRVSSRFSGGKFINANPLHSNHIQEELLRNVNGVQAKEKRGKTFIEMGTRILQKSNLKSVPLSMERFDIHTGHVYILDRRRAT